MKQNIKVKRPGVIRKIKQNRKRIEDARLGIGEKRKAAIAVRIPKRNDSLLQCCDSVMPDRIIKTEKIPPKKSSAFKNNAWVSKNKNGKI